MNTRQTPYPIRMERAAREFAALIQQKYPCDIEILENEGVNVGLLLKYPTIEEMEAAWRRFSFFLMCKQDHSNPIQFGGRVRPGTSCFELVDAKSEYMSTIYVGKWQGIANTVKQMFVQV